jgi:hypothetical protein
MTVLNTASVNVNVADIVDSGGVAKEDAIISVLVKFGWTVAIATGGDKGAKNT